MRWAFSLRLISPWSSARHTGHAFPAYRERDALGTVLGGDLRRPGEEHTRANEEEAISYAAYRTLVDLFPDLAAEYDAMMVRLGYDPVNATSDASTPASVGNEAAAAILVVRREDGANQLGGYADYTGYMSVNRLKTPTCPALEIWSIPCYGNYSFIRSTGSGSCKSGPSRTGSTSRRLR